MTIKLRERSTTQKALNWVYKDSMGDKHEGPHVLQDCSVRRAAAEETLECAEEPAP